MRNWTYRKKIANKLNIYPAASGKQLMVRGRHADISHLLKSPTINNRTDKNEIKTMKMIVTMMTLTMLV